MAYYNDYSVWVEHKVFHRFTCKYCGQTSSWMPTTIRGGYTLRYSTDSRIDKYDLEKKLNAGAQRNLQKKIDIMKEYTSKGYKIDAPSWIKSENSYSFDTKCSHCKKAQGKRIWRHFFSAFGFGVLLLILLGLITTEFIDISDDLIEIWVYICIFVIPTLLFIYWRRNYRKKVKGPVMREYNWNGK